MARAHTKPRKIEQVSDEYVYSRGCSDKTPYKRRRQIFKNVRVEDCRALAAEKGLVARAMNLGENLLYTQSGLDLEDPTSHLLPFISFVGRNFLCDGDERTPSVMEVWGAPEPCTQEEADRYFVERALVECREHKIAEYA